MASTDAVLSNTKKSEASFDVSTPEARARLLVALKSHVGDFSEVEHHAYDMFRDALLRLARGEGSSDSLEGYAQTLGRFVSSPEKKIEIQPEVSAAPQVEVKVEKEIKKEVPAQNEVAVPAPVISRGRRGPDIRTTADEGQSATPVSVSVETPKEESVIAQEEKIPVVEKVVAAESAPTLAEISKSTPPVPEQNTIRSLREKIEKINDGLNEFAHGAAFKWLSDTSTGYRAYLNELLELRGLLNEVSEVSEEDMRSFATRVDALEGMANAVRRKVGGETEEVVTPNVASVQSAPQAQEVPLPVAPSLEKESEEIVPWGASVESSKTEVVSQNITTEEHVPLVKEQEAPAQPPVSEAQVDASDTDTLHTPVIDSGLNDLLTRWLGTTGFLGFGDAGVKHPDWLKMKDLFVEDVLHGDGVVPPGLKPELFENLGKNITGWRDAYALYPLDTEKVEHYIRRVVEISVSK